MIRGEVTARREAFVRLIVQGPSGSQTDVEAMLDTGFSNYAILPPDLIRQLLLEPAGETQATLGDGTTISMRIYYASVLWDGQERRVFVQESSAGVLVGMALLHGYNLNMDIVDGGQVTITPLVR